MIRLERVTKVFAGSSAPAVDHVSMEVAAGEICVLLGPSGCGKTMTLKMVNRLIEPTSGEIYIDGRNTAGQNPVELRRSLGYVIQQIGLFPNKTIEENICIVPDILGWDSAKSRKRAAELLEMAALDRVAGAGTQLDGPVEVLPLAGEVAARPRRSGLAHRLVDVAVEGQLALGLLGEDRPLHPARQPVEGLEGEQLGARRVVHRRRGP